MKIISIIESNSVSADLSSTGKMDVLAELGSLLAGEIPEIAENDIVKTLVERERLATTGVGGGVAIPHGKLPGIKQIAAAIGISKTGIDFGAVDNEPVHIFVALVAPLNSSGDHLRALAKISRILKDSETRNRFRNARNEAELLEILEEEDGKS